MSTVAYKCPNCASPLTFDGASGKMICGACDSQFDLAAVEAMYAAQTGGGIDFDVPDEGYNAADMAQMKAYRCKSCGAELITEGTTTATECPYCGSPTILPDRIEGGIRPELVVPFVISKEEAQKMFEDYFQGKKLLPNIFKKDNQIAEIRKLYVPYWLFDCDADATIVYSAEKRRTQRTDDWEIETIEHYIVNRSGTMSFENIPVDGSVKLDNKISESLEPYDLTKAVPFSPSVLSGSLADHADVDAADCEKRAVERVENSITTAIRNTVTGYTSVSERSKGFSSKGGKVTAVLLPVWLITTVKDGKTYTFAINGQTGKLTCDVPTDKGKAFLWGAGAFAGVMGVGALILYLLKQLAGGTMLIVGIVGLIVALCVVGGLIGQLKQAASQSSAAGYSREGGLQLSLKQDLFLYTKTNRKKIEKQEQA
ncbi:MAG: hypothetical protein J6K72_08035 [Clostridia bacterium]|nr:hypothetical protein [Clostridia bacterium]